MTRWSKFHPPFHPSHHPDLGSDAAHLYLGPVPPRVDGRRRTRGVAALAALASVVLPLVACSAAEPSGDVPRESGDAIVRVPQDAESITDAVARVAEGGLVLVEPGTYHESVLIDTPDVTLRGTDRNAVVIDGEGLRANGVQAIADGVRIQNLTVVNHTFNGVLVTGMHDENGPLARNLDGYERLDPEKFPPLRRFEISHVTASDNGLYGIYAFNARNGAISDNYASGSADAGIYVGQCEECDILVQGNVAENNAIGYENANASDSVVIAGNRFAGNRVGLTLLSWYQEAFMPQRKATVVGNLIAGNAAAESPAHANGAFGVGIGLSGANGNVFERNLIADNPSAGLQVTNTEDVASTDNSFEGNRFEQNGVDIADLSSARSPSSGTCVSDATGLSLIPADLLSGCEGGTITGADAASLPPLTVPPGMSFLRVPTGPDQPQLPGELDTVPSPLPDAVGMPALAGFPLPDRELLRDRAR